MPPPLDNAATNSHATESSTPIPRFSLSLSRRQNQYVYRLLVFGLTLSLSGTIWLHQHCDQGDLYWNFLEEIYHVYDNWRHPYWQFVPRRPHRHRHSHCVNGPMTEQHPQQQQSNHNHDDQKPLNILLLYADDWRHDSLGVAGNPHVKTPFLDSMAKRGIRFTHNSVSTSICWMSRATLHTGLYASQHGGWMPTHPYWYHHWYRSFPYLLTSIKNYAVAHVGKWDYFYFHDISAIFKTYFFSRIYQYQHWYTQQQVEDELQHQTKTTNQPRYFPDTRHYKTPSHGPHQDQIHVTDRTVQDALEFLTHRPNDRPFMLTVSFFPPHAQDGSKEQWFPQPETAQAYDTMVEQDLCPEVPPTYNVASMNASFARLPHPIFQQVGNEARKRWHDRFDNTTADATYSQMLQRYYRMITGVDTACQQLVQELERQDLLNSTLVIFTTDNGYYHGEHGLAGKWFPHEESIRVPLIVLDPRMSASQKGTTRDEFTLNVDLAPTLLQAANTPVPKYMQGRDISTLYRPQQSQPAPEWREEFYYEHPQFWDEVFLPASTAVVRKSHKYIQWGTPPDKVEQLFDLQQDPREEVDVSRHPDYADLLDEMRQRHEELRSDCCSDKETGDLIPLIQPVTS